MQNSGGCSSHSGKQSDKVPAACMNVACFAGTGKVLEDFVSRGDLVLAVFYPSASASVSPDSWSSGAPLAAKQMATGFRSSYCTVEAMIKSRHLTIDVG